MKLKAQILNGLGNPQTNGHIAAITGTDAVLELEKSSFVKGLRAGSHIRFQILDPVKGIMKYRGIVFSILDTIVYIKELEILEVVQRREDVKAYLEFNSRVTPFLYPTMGSTEVVISDISCGGVCITADRELDTTIIYTVFIPFTKLPLDLKFQIMRIIKSDDKKTFVYGCRFVNLKYEEEAIIRSYVFRVQVEERNRKKQIEEMEVALAEEVNQNEEGEGENETED